MKLNNIRRNVSFFLKFTLAEGNDTPPFKHFFHPVFIHTLVVKYAEHYLCVVYKLTDVV